MALVRAPRFGKLALASRAVESRFRNANSRSAKLGTNLLETLLAITVDSVGLPAVHRDDASYAESRRDEDCCDDA